MTSREFIERQLGNADGKTRELSSIYKDGNGQIYSYYHHYPLVFQAAGLTFVNTRGYSSTTGKHISWAWRAAGYNSIGVELSGCNQYSYRNPENKRKVANMLYENANGYGKHSDRQILRAVLRDLKTELAGIDKDMSAKTRKDTMTYAMLVDKHNQVRGYIARVEGAL